MTRYKAILLLLILLAAACKTIGVAREKGGYGMISPTVANAMMLDTPQAVVIDFRPDSEYNGTHGHIAGALSVPLDTIETRLAELIPYANSTVLVYGESEEDAGRGARLLVASGFRNVIVMRGGIGRWIELGYKTVTSI